MATRLDLSKLNLMDALDLADCREAQRRVVLLVLYGNRNPVACEMRQSK